MTVKDYLKEINICKTSDLLRTKTVYIFVSKLRVSWEQNIYVKSLIGQIICLKKVEMPLIGVSKSDIVCEGLI